MLTARRTLKKTDAPKRRSRKRLQGGRIATLGGGNYGTPGEVVQRGGLSGTIKTYTYLFAGPKILGPSITLGTLGARGSSNFGKSGGMVFDNDGIMYIATSCGILKIDKSGTTTRYVTPLQLGTEGSTAVEGSLYLALAWLGTTKSTLIAGSISPDAFTGNPVYPLVLIKLGTPPIVTRKTNLLYNVMTMCSDSQGNVYWTGDDCCSGLNYSITQNRLSVVYKIDPTGTTVVPFLGSETGPHTTVPVGGNLPINTTNGLGGNRGPMGGLSYNPIDNSIYTYNLSGGAQIVKISLTDNKIYGLADLPVTGTVQGAKFLGAYASVVDPVLNVMYMYNANWDGSGLGYAFMYDLTTKQFMRFCGTGTAGNSLTESGLFPAGESTIVVPTSTNAGSFSSTTKGFPSTCRHMAIDAAGYVYFGAYGGGNQSSAGMAACALYMVSPYGPPQAPSTFSVDVDKTTATSLTITWSNDTNAAEYEFTITPNTPGIVMPKGRATTATFSQLADSTSYVITLRAKNMLGVAPTITTFPAASTKLNTEGFALSKATPVSMNLIGTTSTVVGVSLSWAGIPNVAYVKYTITPTTPAGAAITETIPQNPGNSVTKTPYTVTGLGANTTYSVTVQGSLSNTFPAGSISTLPSNSLSFTTPASVPPMYLGTLVGGPSKRLGTTLNRNRAITLDNAGNMYIASTTCIYKVSPSTSTINWLFDTSQTFPTPTAIPYNPTKLPIGVGGSTATLFAGSSTAGSPSTTPQTGAAVAFGNIVGMTYNSTENALYVLDSTNNVIVKVTLATPVTASIVAGQLGVAPSSSTTTDGGIGTNTLSGTTSNIFSDQNGQLYITDSADSKVRVLNTTANANTISTAQILLNPSSSSSIVQLPDGTLLVASTSTNQIFRLTITSTTPLTYKSTLFAGKSGPSGNADGPVDSATFNKPTSLAVDAAANVYVYDSGNCSIRVIIGGNVYTYLGGNPGLIDGLAASAGLSVASGTDAFSGMMFDSNGFLYISDSVNNAVRVVAPYPADQVISDSQLKGYTASAAQASSALVQTASSAVAQVASSALAQEISGARQSSAVAQEASKAEASSALAQYISGSRESSAVAQVASSALAQEISGARQSSAVAQQASSALAQEISGAQQSSAVAQEASKAQASSALAQEISGAQQSSAVAQEASKAQASSALAQEISGARHSSAVAQVASSALAQEISGAQQSSAVAQEASKAQASSALAQEISGARHSSAVAQQDSSAQQQAASSAVQQADSSAQQQEASASVEQRASSAVAQVASSALAQEISGAQQSSAVAQEASKAQASSALAQEISGARHSSAVAQQDSSAQQQAASSAVQQADSSAQQQAASSAKQQFSSSAIQQADSSAQQQAASSAVQQADSSAQEQTASASVQQRASSAEQQSASSAMQQTDLAAAVTIKDAVKEKLKELQADIAASAKAMYTEEGTTVSGSVMLSLQNKMLRLEEAKRELLTSSREIFRLNPNYQDPSLQTIVQDNTLSAFGVKKVFDALRNNYIFLDSSNRIVANPLTPFLRAYTSGATQGGGGKRRKKSRKSAVLFYKV